MKRGGRIIFWLLLALVAGGAGHWLMRPAEPEYRGRKLSDWLERRYSDDVGAWNEAAEAFRQMGTNAVPHLIRMLGGPKTDARRSYEATISKLPDKIHHPLYALGAQDQKAADALAVIGPAAEPAIPALLGKLGDFSPGMGSGNPYVIALAEIGPPAALPVAEILLGDDERVRWNAWETLFVMRTNARPAVAAIIRFGELRNGDARADSILLLGRAKEPAEIILPHLIRCLDDPSAEVRTAAIEALGGYAAAAKRAVPKLAELAEKDANAKTRKAAEVALKQIMPGVKE